MIISNPNTMSYSEANLQLEERLMRDPLYDPPQGNIKNNKNPDEETNENAKGNNENDKGNNENNNENMNKKGKVFFPSLLAKIAFEGDKYEEIKSDDEVLGHLPMKPDDMDDIAIEELPTIKHSSWYSIFNDHPNRFGQTYIEHMFDSLKYSFISLFCSIVFFLHAIFPFMFQFTGSDWIIYLGQMFIKKRKMA